MTISPSYIRERIIGVLRDFEKPFSIRAICRAINGKHISYCNSIETKEPGEWQTSNWCRHTTCEIKYYQVLSQLQYLKRKEIVSIITDKFPDIEMNRGWDRLAKVEFLGVKNPSEKKDVQMRIKKNG